MNAKEDFSKSHITDQSLFSLAASTAQSQSEALQNLFKSLSNLAREQDVKPTNLSLQHHSSSPSIQGSEQSPAIENSLASSIQSAVAAALMQRQFSCQQQQQQAAPSLANQPTNSSISNTIRTTLSSTFLEKQVPSFSQAANLDQNIFQSKFNIKQHQQQHQQQQQRINYCTICNKELCNKYFMKTHMLKMHGINLEIEQTGNNDSSSSPDTKETDQSDFQETEKQSSTDQSLSSTKLDKSPNSPPISVGKKQAAASAIKQPTSVMNGFAGNSMGGVVCDICNKELCSKYFLKVHKQNTHGIMTDYQDTSAFVYPFASHLASSSAPNPFSNPLTAAAAAAASMGMAQAAQPALIMFGGRTINDQSPPAMDYNGQVAKKPRLMKTQDIGAPRCESFVSGTSNQTQAQAHLQQLDTVYRLMQQNLGQDNLSGLQTNVAPAAGSIAASATKLHHLPPFGPIDHMSAATNPINALMCFGGLTPFGPAGMSLALVVDMILRNQHLFNRKINSNNNNSSQSEQATVTKSSSKDKNNNNSDSKSKGSKYFSHYTEACPMCDRRFKSIKWLKTHMMNDHKQEIGAYMQMMVQYLFSNKSQPNFSGVNPITNQHNSMQCNIVAQQQQQQQSQLQQQQNFASRRSDQDFSDENLIQDYSQSRSNNSELRNLIMSSNLCESPPSSDDCHEN